MRTLNQNENILIPVGTHHFLENKTDEELVIIEIQFGDYLEEDDIIRLDDPYNRSKNVV